MRPAGRVFETPDLKGSPKITSRAFRGDWSKRQDHGSYKGSGVNKHVPKNIYDFIYRLSQVKNEVF